MLFTSEVITVSILTHTTVVGGATGYAGYAEAYPHVK